MSDTAPTTDLADRYGTAPSRWRPLGLGAIALLVVAFVAWVAWAAIEHGTPDVDADVVRFDILNDHEVEVGVQVRLRDGVRADCRLRAIAEDKHTVGDLPFTPTDGRNTVTMRTERRATSVELLRCTTRD